MKINSCDRLSIIRSVVKVSKNLRRIDQDIDDNVQVDQDISASGTTSSPVVKEFHMLARLQ